MDREVWHQESDMTEQQNWTDIYVYFCISCCEAEPHRLWVYIIQKLCESDNRIGSDHKTPTRPAVSVRLHYVTVSKVPSHPTFENPIHHEVFSHPEKFQGQDPQRTCLSGSPPPPLYHPRKRQWYQVSWKMTVIQVRWSLLEKQISNPEFQGCAEMRTWETGSHESQSSVLWKLPKKNR